MRDDEYFDAIEKIATSGRGYDAIRDITELLERQHENYKMIVKEIKAEKKAAKKILTSETLGNRYKIETVLGFLGGE